MTRSCDDDDDDDDDDEDDGGDDDDGDSLWLVVLSCGGTSRFGTCAVS